MKRRDFLQSIGAGAVTVCASPKISLALDNSTAPSVLVEAQQFENRGGWVLDTQFYDELGFCYLLAHGLGEPVDNAQTTVEFPEPGTYHVWVRTKDWVPGDWKAPGRFELLVNDQSIGTTFGTEAGWGWQSGGTVDIQNAENRVGLKDLTGFDGRCDAIYFSKDPSDVPPNQEDRLKQWRKAHRDVNHEILNYDVVIAGGGLAGCGAALAANEQGIDVALIQDRPLLGGNASEEVRVHTLGIHGKAEDLISKIDTPHYDNGSPKAKQAQQKREKNMREAEHVDLYLGHSVYDARTRKNPNTGDIHITAVDAVEIETGDRRRFKAPNFIDCTGDGWVGYWAGADFRYGRESKHEFDEGWEKYGDLWSPEEPDNRVLGSSMLWNTEKTGERVDFPEVPWAKPVAKDHATVESEWYWEFSHNDIHQVDDAEDIRDHMFRAAYGSFANAKKDPKHATRDLKWVAHVIGKRESRRLMGDHIYVMDDAVKCRRFDDAVVMEEREVDIHYQRARKGSPYSFLSKAIFRPVEEKHYYIPFRSLYSRNVDNLMMAGRCFSCSHIGLGGPRVMNTCAQMGVAVGYASSLCKEHDTTPRGIYEDHLDELKELTGFDPESVVMRTSDQYPYEEFPEELANLHRVTVDRGDSSSPAPGFSFQVNKPATVYLAVHKRGDYSPPGDWENTSETATWTTGSSNETDVIYRKDVEAGTVQIPKHTGSSGKHYGVPHAAFIAAQDGKQSNLNITNVSGASGELVSAP